MNNITTNQFHTSQILLTDRVIRNCSWSSHALYGCAIALSLATFAPSHISQKVTNICTAIAMFTVSNRLDRLVDYARGYTYIGEVQSQQSYQTWLNHSMKPPAREMQLAPPVEIPAPVKFTDIKTALSKPHMLLLGETNSGKSTLVKFLVSHASAPSLVLDSHAAPDDWQNMNVIGMGRNYPAIGDEVDRLVELMNNRYEARGKGQKQFEPLIVVLDEFPACVANLGKSFTENIMLLVREARKVSIKLIVLSQGSEVKSLGIEGQGSIRECFAMIAIGKFATEKAKSLKDEQIKAFIDSAQYPAMLDDLPCQLPQIDRVNLPVLPLPKDYLMLTSGNNQQLPIAPPSSAMATQSQSTAIAPVFQKIVNYLDGKDWKKDYEIKASIREFKDADTPLTELQGYLQFLETQNLLETRSTQRGALEARVIRDKTA
jgi:hypothetical protein